MNVIAIVGVFRANISGLRQDINIFAMSLGLHVCSCNDLKYISHFRPKAQMINLIAVFTRS